MRKPLLALALLVFVALLGCQPIPPQPAAPRDGTPIAASFGKTWDAAIDEFATRAIPIETLDRASGLIVPRGYSLTPTTEAEAKKWADCGRDMLAISHSPATVKFNVVVRGDSVRSTVQVRAFYATEAGVACQSRGIYEQNAEDLIRARAERRVQRTS